MARMSTGESLGATIINGSNIPGTFEIVSTQRCYRDGRETFINFHDPHTDIPNHNFSAANSCPADNNQSWPQMVPYNGGWLGHQSLDRTDYPDDCNAFDPPVNDMSLQSVSEELVTCFDRNGNVLWEKTFLPTDFNCPSFSTRLGGFPNYEDVYFVTGNRNSRALTCINRNEYLGDIGPGGTSLWNARYQWADFDSSGNMTLTDAFTIQWWENDSTRTDFIPAWATNKTYVSGSGYIVTNGLNRMDAVLCLTSGLNLVAQIGGGASSSTIPSGATFRGRWCMPSNLDDSRVNIRLVYTPSGGGTNRTVEIWSITFDGVSAPSIAQTATYSMPGVGNNWMPATDGWAEITSWTTGDGTKAAEYWHRFDDPTPVLRPNPENVEAVFTSFDNGDAYTTTHVGSMVHIVSDFHPTTGIDHTGDSPYNGDRFGEQHYVNRFNFVNWQTGTSGSIDYEFILPDVAYYTTVTRPYPHYGDFDFDDAAVFQTNPHTNRAFVWQRYYWAAEGRYDGPGENHGQSFFDTYIVVQIGENEDTAPPPMPEWVNFFDLAGVAPGGDCPMLGVGVNEVYLYDRGGTRSLGKLTNTGMVRYTRVRDDISTATIVINKPDPDCCDMIQSAHVGRTEVVIFRNGERVWEGPITRMAYSRATVEITVADVFHYTSRTIMRAAYDNRYNKKKSKVGPITKRAQAILANEMIRKERLGYNLLKFLDVRTHPKTTRTSRFTPAYASTVWEELDYMAAKLSLDYTAVGRRMLINDVHDVIGRTEMLTDKDFADDIIITSYGMELATRYAVSDGEGHWAAVGGVDPFYGEVELITNTYGEDVQATTPGHPTKAELQALQREMTSQAQRNLAGRYPIPTVVRVPDGTPLSPLAPVDFSQLVPGMRVPIRATQSCLKLEQEQKIDRVQVEQTSLGETIAITFSPSPGSTPWDDDSQIGDEEA